MKTVGIIAEYNPFHTGHEYHIQKAKEISGADYAVVVMSPDFVQRGEPAIFDKYTRARMALMCGADLVIELPVCYATGSAEYFAEGAVSLLNQLGVVDSLCFGAETDNRERFQLVASILREEPEAYRCALQTNLKTGLTFPHARSEALRPFLTGTDSKRFLETPNNILGIEYCKALQKSGSSIAPLPIKRTGSDYNSRKLDGAFCSASAIRAGIGRIKAEYQDSCPGNTIKDTGSADTELFLTAYRGGSHLPSDVSFAPDADASARMLSYIPKGCHPLFAEACRFTVSPEDLLPYFHLRLLDAVSNAVLDTKSCTCVTNRFSDILDITDDLSDRIERLRFSCLNLSYEDCIQLLKTRQMTETRIRRALLHLILNIRSDEVELLRSSGITFYAHVLGFRRDASPLLHQIKKESTIPLITKTANAAKVIPEHALSLWKTDLYASHLYRSIQNRRYQLSFRSEYQLSPVLF